MEAAALNYRPDFRESPMHYESVATGPSSSGTPQRSGETVRRRGMRINRQVETAQRDIRAGVLVILSRGNFLELPFGRMRLSARRGLGGEPVLVG